MQIIAHSAINLNNIQYNTKVTLMCSIYHWISSYIPTLKSGCFAVDWTGLLFRLELSGLQYILILDLTMTNCFSLCELRNVAGVGVYMSRGPEVIIQLLVC